MCMLGRSLGCGTHSEFYVSDGAQLFSQAKAGKALRWGSEASGPARLASAFGATPLVNLLCASSGELRLHDRLWSITVGLLLLAEWISLGRLFAAVKEAYEGFGIGERFRPQPLNYRIVMSLDWRWCVAVGLLLAAGVILKDRWCPPRLARRINMVVLWAGFVILVASICLAFAPVYKTP